MEFSDLGKHCIWADKEVSKLLSTVPKSDFTKVPEHTGRSLQDLVAHILAGYEMVLGGNYKDATDKYGAMKQKDLLTAWNTLVEKFIEAIESDPKKSYMLKMEDGTERKIEGQNYLLSYTDHSTYHRGQIITTFKVVTGKEAISTDFYTYLTKKNPI